MGYRKVSDVVRKPKKPLGISVVIDCESCMQWHIEQAVTVGASEKEVFEVIEAGIEMGGGPTTVSAFCTGGDGRCLYLIVQI